MSAPPTSRAHSRKQSAHGEGFGLLYDDKTGSVTFKSGTSSTIVNERSQVQPPLVDPNTKFAIPNETQLREDKAKNKASSSVGNRKITHRGDGDPVNMSNMPFRPQGLQWMGRSCITTTRLMADRDERIGMSNNASKSRGSPPNWPGDN